MFRTRVGDLPGNGVRESLPRRKRGAMVEHVRFAAIVALMALTVVVTRDSGAVYPLCAVLLVVLGWQAPRR